MAKEGPRQGAAWVVAGTTLLGVPFAGCVAAALGFFAGVPLTRAMAVVSVLGGLAAGAAMARALRLPKGVAAAATLGVVALVLPASGLLASLVYDLGFDSQSYHQRAITELVSGWNPFREKPSATGVYAPFVGHYSGGVWVQAALVALSTGDLETAKLVNLVALAAAFCLARGALEYGGFARGSWATVLALAAAANPVSLVQAFTFYVDGYVASMLVCSAAALALVVALPRLPSFLPSAMALVLLANAKFTGAVFALPLLALGLAATCVRHRSWVAARRFAGVHSAALVLAAGVVGFHPYVTNTVAHGHPFYPLRGPVVAHTIDGLRPPALAREGRVARLVRSVFADPAAPWRDSAAIYKPPLTVTAEELAEYAAPDARVGGWGPLFSAAALAAVIGAGLVVARSRREGAALGLVAGTVLVSALINGECWWARLAPQIALLPIVVAAFLGKESARPGECHAAGALLGVVLGNAILVVAAQALHIPERSAAVRRFLEGLAEERVTVYVAGRWIAPLRRLRDHGVPFVAVPDDGDEPDPSLASRVPCGPLRAFPGTMNEIRYCVTRGEERLTRR